jgi:hypothetical protein
MLQSQHRSAQILNPALKTAAGSLFFFKRG